MEPSPTDIRLMSDEAMQDVLVSLAAKAAHQYETPFGAEFFREVQRRLYDYRRGLEDAAAGFDENGLYTRANKIYRILEK